MIASGFCGIEFFYLFLSRVHVSSFLVYLYLFLFVPFVRRCIDKDDTKATHTSHHTTHTTTRWNLSLKGDMYNSHTCIGGVLNTTPSLKRTRSCLVTTVISPALWPLGSSLWLVLFVRRSKPHHWSCLRRNLKKVPRHETGAKENA